MTHQAKRQYGGSQPSITSYFSPASSPCYSLSSSSASQYNGCSPPLPATVQSNLLSVGMRVRKSVPEGYKTGSYASNALPSSTCTSSTTTSSTSTSANIYNATPSSTATKPKTRPRAGNRELTPFCGILKVGGMDHQPWEIYNSSSSPSSPEFMVEEEQEDDVPFLSNQGSTISNYSIDTPSSSSTNKRRFFEDEEDITGNVDGNVGGALGERILAVPRRKKWAGKVPRGVVGQENLRVSTSTLAMGGGMGGDDDFGEADFLVMDDDLEMSG